MHQQLGLRDHAHGLGAVERWVTDMPGLMRAEQRGQRHAADALKRGIAEMHAPAAGGDGCGRAGEDVLARGRGASVEAHDHRAALPLGAARRQRGERTRRPDRRQRQRARRHDVALLQPEQSPLPPRQRVDRLVERAALAHDVAARPTRVPHRPGAAGVRAQDALVVAVPAMQEHRRAGTQRRADVEGRVEPERVHEAVDARRLPGAGGGAGDGRTRRHALAMVSRFRAVATDALASHPRFARHLAPVLLALPAERRGRLDQSPAALAGAGPLLVADAARDLPDALATGRPVVLMEHGVGQRYGGQRLGGDGRRGDVALYLAPGPYAADWWRARWPGVPCVEVGAPPAGVSRGTSFPQATPVVAVSFRFHLVDPPSPELRSSAAHYLGALPALAGRYRLIGHGHPRAWPWLASAYRRLGIEVVHAFRDVLLRADAYCADNSSTLYEAAAAGLPVVALDAPWYRREVEHGLRFWGAVPGGRASGPSDLPEAIADALQDGPGLRQRRQDALAVAYSSTDGRSAERAAAAVVARWG